MILSLVFALLTALGLLLRGSWDLWAQALLQMAAIVGASLWLVSRAVGGYVPLPSRRTLWWTGLLMALSAMSACLSPVHGLARPEWYNTWTALWMFPAIAALTKDQRLWVDQAIRVSAWILMLLAFYQRFVLGHPAPSSALSNPNIYAGAVVLLLPLAFERNDYLLSLGLLWSLWWSGSVGAWLGLSLTLIWVQRRLRRFVFWAGAAVAFACAVGLYGKLNTPDIFNRLWWWKAAASMALDRPWTGYGPGAFAYVSPAYLPPGPGHLQSLYAHQYVLQTLAEYGFAYALVWFAGLWHCLARNTSHKRFGVVAAGIHALWDYSLSMPSNLWLFSYFAASSIPETAEGVNVPMRWKLPCVLVVAAVGAAGVWHVWWRWEGDRSLARAGLAAREGRVGEAKRWTSRAMELTSDNPQAFRDAAALEFLDAQSLGRPMSSAEWERVADYMESSVRLDPYRASSWNILSGAYERLGRPDLAYATGVQAQRYRAR